MKPFFYPGPGILITWIILLLGLSASGQLTAGFSTTPLSGCAPLYVSFTDQSTGNPVAWEWDLGNGSLSSLQNPTTTYFNGGSYTVTLTVTNSNGLRHTTTKSNYIQVNNKPDVNFSAINTSGCFPVRTNFTDLSTAGSGSIISWAWDFGDGFLSSAQNPSHTYLSAGTYAVTLKVINSGGCSKVITRPGFIQASPGVSADFSNTTPVSCNPPEIISFTNNATGPGSLSYEWQFGDGSTSSLQHPSHTYTAGGNYNVTLITQSSLGCVDTLVRNAAIHINDMNTDFTGTSQLCAGIPSVFSNISTPAPIITYWDFGDGSSSTLNNPLKSWNTAGVYNVMMINHYPSCTDTMIKPVTVLGLPVPAFRVSDSIDCDAPFAVDFTDMSSGAVAWSWDFGDGNTSTSQHPSHTYMANGNYNVKLTVTGINGCSDSLIKASYIRIQRPVTGINGLPLEGCIPYTMNPAPNVTAVDGVASYYWDFGDGTGSSLQNPVHTYPLQGVYNVKLVITTNDGCMDSATVNNAIRVGIKPTANFSATPTSQCVGQPVQFSNLTNPSDRWLWDFGDGGTSVTESPQYAYSDTGSFDISLVAWNYGCRDTLVIENYINTRPPVANFYPQFNCNNKKSVIFYDISTVPQTWLWNFGDGTTSTLSNPVHTFSAFGTYNVTLTVTNGSCSHTRSAAITLINEVADFSATANTICTSQAAQFNVSGINPANISGYSWDYGDGVIEQGTAVQEHHYADPGLYSVKLIVTDIRGCRDTIVKPNLITVYGPKANFINPVTGCNPMQAVFSDLSNTDGVHAIVNWIWDYGDGNVQSYTAPPFNHLFAQQGSYLPSLTVTDAYGCTSSFNAPAAIYVTDPNPLFSSPDTLTCAGASVHFNNASVGDSLSWSWDFGDGTSSATAAPVKAYAGDGNYTIKLVVKDINGCKDSLVLNNYVKVKTATASFSIADSISSCTPFEVAFANTSLNATSAAWDFNDGAFSELINPTHYYSAPGVFNAKLVVAGHGGCIDSAFRTIRLYPSDAVLTYSPYAGCSPLETTLHISTPGPVTYLWDLSDGSTIPATDSSLVYNYLLPGDFLPKVIMEDQTGCRIPVPGTDTIHVTRSDVFFAANDSLFCDNGTVTFTNATTSNALISGYTWTFGDGNSSSQQSPVHSYPSPGLYTVTLSATTLNGCRDTSRKTNYIKVAASPVIAIGGNEPLCMQKRLSFTGMLLQADTSALSWQWNFGNGNWGPGQYPSPQSYNTAGTFPLQLVVTNSSGCVDSVNTSVTVYPLPSVNAGSDRILPVGTSVNLLATSSPVSTYSWSPPEELSCVNCASTVASPKFSTTYTISVTDANGCMSSDAVQISVTCTDRNVFIPNTFSPNNDGMNDVFYPRGKGLFTVKSMRIFNRWGELVFGKTEFPANEAASGWNGLYKGRKASMDVYTYLIEIMCENNELITYKGNISLVQ